MTDPANADQYPEVQASSDPTIGKRLIVVGALSILLLVGLGVAVYFNPEGRALYTAFGFLASIWLVAVEWKRFYARAKADPEAAKSLPDREFLILVLPAMVVAVSLGLEALDVFEGREDAFEEPGGTPSKAETVPPE